MTRILLRKIKDNLNGEHPNQIHKGFTIEGYMMTKPVEGLPFIVSLKNTQPVFTTSEVTKVLSPTEFETKNGTYMIKILD